MSDSILDDETNPFLILVNDEQQYSIWPQALLIPAGWQKVQGPMPRPLCMEWLAEHWVDLRPRSLQSLSDIS